MSSASAMVDSLSRHSREGPLGRTQARHHPDPGADVSWQAPGQVGNPRFDASRRDGNHQLQQPVGADARRSGGFGNQGIQGQTRSISRRFTGVGAGLPSLGSQGEVCARLQRVLLSVQSWRAPQVRLLRVAALRMVVLRLRTESLAICWVDRRETGYFSLSSSASSSSFVTRSLGLSRTFLYRTVPDLSIIA